MKITVRRRDGVNVDFPNALEHGNVGDVVWIVAGDRKFVFFSPISIELDAA